MRTDSKVSPSTPIEVCEHVLQSVSQTGELADLEETFSTLDGELRLLWNTTISFTWWKTSA